MDTEEAIKHRIKIDTCSMLSKIHMPDEVRLSVSANTEGPYGARGNLSPTRRIVLESPRFLKPSNHWTKDNVTHCVFSDKNGGHAPQLFVGSIDPNRRDSDEENGVLWETLHAFKRFMF